MMEEQARRLESLWFYATITGATSIEHLTSEEQREFDELAAALGPECVKRIRAFDSWERIRAAYPAQK